jgi:hypothetical protein
MVMVFNATFNNISVILWRSVLLIEENEIPRTGENQSIKQYTNSQLIYISLNIFYFITGLDTSKVMLYEAFP